MFEDLDESFSSISPHQLIQLIFIYEQLTGDYSSLIGLLLNS